MTAPFPPVERLCKIAHDAYERAAAEHGWQTNPASRKPWADVPEPNKATMRAAMAAAWSYICDDYLTPYRAEVERLTAENARLRVAAERLLADAEDVPTISMRHVARILRAALTPDATS